MEHTGRVRLRRLAAHYDRVVLGACCLAGAVTSTVWYSFSAFYPVILKEFGWSRADTALAFSLMVIVGGAAEPLVGALTDRFGARVMFPVGGLLVAAGLFSAGQMNSLWELYLAYGILLALGKGATGMVPIGTVLQNWFRRRLGMATGVAASSIAVGMLTVPLVQYLIAAFGWRVAFRVLALAALVLVPVPTGLLIRQRPQDLDVLPDGDLSAPAARARARGSPLGDDGRVVDREWAGRDWAPLEAIRTHRFWYLFAGMVLGVLAHQVVLVHQIAHVNDLGYSLAVASFVFALVGVSSAFAKFGWGWLSDRIGRELTYTLGVVALIGGVVALLAAGSRMEVLYLYSLLFGVGYAAGAPLYPAMAADLFQGRRFGTIYGLVNVSIGIGAALGAWFGGFMFDQTRTYLVAFSLTVVFASLSSLCFWLAGPRQVRLVAGRVPATAAEPVAKGH